VLCSWLAEAARIRTASAWRGATDTSSATRNSAVGSAVVVLGSGWRRRCRSLFRVEALARRAATCGRPFRGRWLAGLRRVRRAGSVMYERVSTNGLGWSDVSESPSPARWLFGSSTATKLCLERAGGQQRCFAESENQIAIDSDCQRTDFSCGGGRVWCCPRGFPESASPTNPGYVATPRRIPAVLMLVTAGLVMAGAWYAVSRFLPAKTELSRQLREAV